MNEITLMVTISRANHRQVMIRFNRDGDGDDMVAQKADFLEGKLLAAGQELVAVCGGKVMENPDSEK